MSLKTNVMTALIKAQFQAVQPCLSHAKLAPDGELRVHLSGCPKVVLANQESMHEQKGYVST